MMRLFRMQRIWRGQVGGCQIGGNPLLRIHGAAPRYQSEGFRVNFNDLFSSS